MKITKTRLKEIIKEEVQKILEGKKPRQDVSGVKVEKGGFIGPPITEPVFEEEEEEELDEMSTAGGVTASVEGAPSKRIAVDEQ